MKVLVDTQGLIWGVDDPAQLSVAAAAALQNLANELWISSGTIWELAIKVNLAKLKLSTPFLSWISQAIDPAQQRRGLSELRTPDTPHAPAVSCSAWFGATTSAPASRRPQLVEG
jgi:PIN domain nuclease of toxin-antitoxin system